MQKTSTAPRGAMTPEAKAVLTLAELVLALPDGAFMFRRAGQETELRARLAREAAAIRAACMTEGEAA